MIRTIGVLGGGQLGRMLALEAKRMGLRVVTLDPLPNSPCGQVADEQIVAAYDDLRAVGELGARCDVVTYEFENIPVVSVRALEEERRAMRPSGRVLAITQDRLTEKRFVRDCGVATVEFASVTGERELHRAMERVGLPGVLKTVRGGYDGKGQWLVRDEAAALEALAQAQGATLIYEQFVAFDCEVSVISARGALGASIDFPLAENQHDHGILATSIIPARVSPEVEDRARRRGPSAKVWESSACSASSSSCRARRCT